MAEESSSSKAQTVNNYYNVNAGVFYQGDHGTTYVADSNMTMGGSHVTEHRADSLKAIKRKNTSPPDLQTPLKMTATQASSQRERLEDVFHDEIIEAFVNITSFEKFARSKNGLCLDQSDIQTIVKDYGDNVQKQKLELLFKWRQIQGDKATVPEIRHLLQKYFRRDNPSGYIDLGNGIFGVYKTRFLCKNSKVYLGVQISEVAGIQTRAIKFVPKNEKNLREAQILVKLGNHVNVVSIIHAGIYYADPYDYIYIAMELSWTKTVRNMIEECIKLGKPFHEFNAWRLVEQLMRAVEFLHSHNIIHRDLKPDNVLASGDWSLFKVTDFGLSKEIKDGSATIQTDANTGTEGYRSRETYDGVKITVKVDIFSAGATIGEIMANGVHPFGEDQDLWKYKIKNNKNPDLSHLCVVNKYQVINLIKPMLEMDPEKRPTAKEVLNDVSRHFQTFQLNNQQTTTDESLDDMNAKRQKPQDTDNEARRHEYRGDMSTEIQKFHHTDNKARRLMDIEFDKIKSQKFTLCYKTLITSDAEYFCSKLKPNFSLKELKFRNCNVDRNFLLAIQMYIPNGKVEHVDFSGNNQIDLPALTHLMTQWGCRSLDLSNIEFDEKKMNDVRRISKLPQLTTLILDYSSFSGTSNAMEHVAELLKSLENLSLVSSTISTDQFELIACKLSDGIKLQSLNLSHVQLEDEGLKAVCEIINKTNGMKKLSLSNSGLTAGKLEVFSNTVTQMIEELDLGLNSNIGPTDLKKIIKIVKRQHVRKLNLTDLALNKRALKQLIASDIPCEQITELNISENPGICISDVGELAAKWKIQNLNISECWFRDDFKMLPISMKNHKLVWIDITESGRELNEEERKKILSSLRTVANEVRIEEVRSLTQLDKNTNSVQEMCGPSKELGSFIEGLKSEDEDLLKNIIHQFIHVADKRGVHKNIKMEDIFVAVPNILIPSTAVFRNSKDEPGKANDISSVYKVCESIFEAALVASVKISDSKTAEHWIQLIKQKQPIKNILRHPFFWDDKNKLAFICKVAQLVKGSSIALQKTVRDKLNRLEYKNWKNVLIINRKEVDQYNAIFMGKISTHAIFMGKISTHAIKDLTGDNKKDVRMYYDTLSSLLNFIRNHHERFWEQDRQVLACFLNNKTYGYWNFFTAHRFESLFCDVYDVVSSFEQHGIFRIL